jgi:hypothetical protein
MNSPNDRPARSATPRTSSAAKTSHVCIWQHRERAGAQDAGAADNDSCAS